MAPAQARTGRLTDALSREELFQEPAREDPRAIETVEWVVTSLARLSSEQREVVELKIYGNMTFREISVVTGLPLGTVATRYRSALDAAFNWLRTDNERRHRTAAPGYHALGCRSRTPFSRAGVVDRAVADARPPALTPNIPTILAVAAGLLASMALNYWVNDRWIVAWRLFLDRDPSHTATEIAADVAAITDSATGQWVYGQLVTDPPLHDSARQYAVRLQQLIQQLTLDMKDMADEALRKNTQVDGDRHGSRDRHSADDQRVLRMAYRLRT